MADQRPEQGKEYLSAAKAKAASVGTKLFVGIVALIVLWASSLEEQRRNAEAFLAKQQSFRFDSLVNRKAFNGIRAAKGSNSRLSTRQQERLAALDSVWSMRLDSLKKDQAALLTKISFDAFGMRFATPAAWAPVFWLLLVVGLIYYLSAERKRVYSLMARGLRALSESARLPDDAPKQLLPACPSWLAPPPKHDGKVVTAATVADAIGWGHTGVTRRSFVLATAFVIATILMLRAAWIGVVVAEALGTNYAAQIAIVSSVLLLLGVALMISWWSPLRVSDEYGEEELTGLPERRTVITALGIAVVAVIAVTPAQRRIAAGLHRLRSFSKRTRHTRTEPSIQAADLKPGFYVKPQSDVIHYIDRELVVRNVPKTLDLTGLKPIAYPPSNGSFRTQNLHINRAVLSRSAEEAAFDAVDRGQQDLACQILVAAIKDGLQSNTHIVRLAELCAMLAIRNRLPQRLDALVSVIRSSRANEAIMLQNRINTWRDPTSAWRKKWARPGAHWQVPGRLPPTAPSAPRA